MLCERVYECLTQPFAEVYEAHIMYDVNNVADYRKYCGRLDVYECRLQTQTQHGKASLADIFFQKLFGKRRAYQNERIRRYTTA